MHPVAETQSTDGTCGAANRRIEYQNVDAAEMSQDRTDHAANVRFLAQVSADAERAARTIVCKRQTLKLGPSPDSPSDLRAPAQTFERDGAAQTSGGPGDNGYPAGEFVPWRTHQIFAGKA